MELWTNCVQIKSAFYLERIGKWQRFRKNVWIKWNFELTVFQPVLQKKLSFAWIPEAQGDNINIRIRHPLCPLDSKLKTYKKIRHHFTLHTLPIKMLAIWRKKFHRAEKTTRKQHNIPQLFVSKWKHKMSITITWNDEDLLRLGEPTLPMSYILKPINSVIKKPNTHV